MNDFLHTLSNLHPITITMQIKGTPTDGEVILEAVKVAAEFAVNVEYTFKGKTYVVKSNELYGLAREVEGGRT